MKVSPYQFLPSDNVDWEQRRWELATRFAVKLGAALSREEGMLQMSFKAAIDMADMFIIEYEETIIDKVCDQMEKDTISEETAKKMNEQLEEMRKAFLSENTEEE